MTTGNLLHPGYRCDQCISNLTLANDHPGRDWPLANGHPEGLASWKWWSGGTGLLQMVIWRGRTLANDHPEGPASCKWSSRGASLLKMMIGRDWPLAYDHLEEPDSCKWASISNPTKVQPKSLDQNSAAMFWPIFTFKDLTISQPQSLDQEFTSKSWQNFNFEISTNCCENVPEQ